MDFVQWLEQNWFIIGLFISFGGFAIKQTHSFDKLVQDIKQRDEELDKKIDESFNNVSNRMNQNIVAFKEDITKIKLQINEVDEKIQRQEEKRLESLERTRIIMTGVEATLISLHNDGHNGPVTASLNEIEAYKREKSVQ